MIRGDLRKFPPSVQGGATGWRPFREWIARRHSFKIGDRANELSTSYSRKEAIGETESLSDSH